MSKLFTQKQKDFIHWYCLLNNATQSAIKAGYSKKTAYSIGEQNLRKLEIQEAIKNKKKKLVKKIEITKEDLVKRLNYDEKQGQKIYRDGERDRSQGIKISIEAISKMSEMLGFDAPTKIKDVTDDLENMSIEELQKLIKEKSKNL